MPSRTYLREDTPVSTEWDWEGVRREGGIFALPAVSAVPKQKHYFADGVARKPRWLGGCLEGVQMHGAFFVATLLGNGRIF